MTARFIEFYIISRVMRGKSLHTETIKIPMFNITKAIRHLSLDELRAELLKQYHKLKEAPQSRDELENVLLNFSLNKNNKKYVKHFLARITSFIEEQSGTTPQYSAYMSRNPTYEIEHILANRVYDRSEKLGFANQDDFSMWRNKIGALLLLPKSINGSLGSNSYTEKLTTYCSTSGNIYSASLCEIPHNPGFRSFNDSLNRKFTPLAQFGKREIEERTIILAQLFGLIWNDNMFR